MKVNEEEKRSDKGKEMKGDIGRREENREGRRGIL